MNFILINPDYIIYTDGACLGNPGEGGWATIIINNKLKTEKKFLDLNYLQQTIEWS